MRNLVEVLGQPQVLQILQLFVKMLSSIMRCSILNLEGLHTFNYEDLGQTASSQSSSAVHWRVGGGITT